MADTEKEQLSLAAKAYRNVLRALELRLPIALSARALSQTEVELAWKADEADHGLLLERCQGQGCTSFAELKDVDFTKAMHRDGGLTGNTDYRYRLSARAPEGGDWSEIAEVRTRT